METPDVRGDWTDEQVAEAVKANALWYHTIELRPGIVTPGWFDLRPIADRLPWPDVRGKRCLDVGTYDGFLAFELERRGADSVVTVDVASHADWDWPPMVRAKGIEMLEATAGVKGRGFEVACRSLGSCVEKREMSVYDLSPSTVGSFDVVVCGSLLLHLRDPFRALEAIHSVSGSWFMSCEQIDVALSLLHPRRPLTNMDGIERVQWHVPNVAGHRAMIATAGYVVERTVRPYSIPFGASHPPFRAGAWTRFARRLLTGGWGVPHSAVLARPA